ncbi:MULTISPECIES: type VI secretion system amidase effector protein Tae4 [unclassified Desulfovibrio]|uniref:type VI secretion system amidase effector protein Tae4 n=1 Tax=unclassified Desulfovibrio TaxID=2593640 RepID=UPI002FD950B6
MPNRKNTMLTNLKEGSQVKEPKKIISFSELWGNFPTGYPCDENTYEDQCAIRVAVALQRCGASFKTYRGATCGLHKDEKHALRAEELANWLNKRYLANWPAPTDITGTDWQKKADGKTGVIFFKDYWLRKGERYPSGDHIDLWNGSRFPITSAPSAAMNILRFGLGVGSIDLFDIQYSDLAGASKILIWELL